MLMAQQQQVEMEMVFKKVLTGPNLKPRSPLSVPGRALRLLTDSEAAGGLPVIEVEAFDIEGVSHKLAFGKRRAGPYYKPTILKRYWAPFAARKGLIPGDQFTLYRTHRREDSTGNHSYQVRVKRRVFKLFGKSIWVDLEILHDNLPSPSARTSSSQTDFNIKIK